MKYLRFTNRRLVYKVRVFRYICTSRTSSHTLEDSGHIICILYYTDWCHQSDNEDLQDAQILQTKRIKDPIVTPRKWRNNHYKRWITILFLETLREQSSVFCDLLFLYLFKNALVSKIGPRIWFSPMNKRKSIFLQTQEIPIVQYPIIAVP